MKLAIASSSTPPRTEPAGPELASPPGARHTDVSLGWVIAGGAEEVVSPHRYRRPAAARR
jgi:hypothetical protein